MYININNNNKPVDYLTLTGNYVTSDNRLVKNINNNGLCDISQDNKVIKSEWITDIDNNFFVVDIINNNERGSTKRLVPFRPVV